MAQKGGKLNKVNPFPKPKTFLAQENMDSGKQAKVEQEVGDY